MGERKAWESFAHVTSADPAAVAVPPDDLVDMASYGDPLRVFVAYAQDNHLFDAHGQPVAVDAVTYQQAPRLQKVNKFGQAYRDGAKLWLHKDMAAIVMAAARFMKTRYGWTSTLYDGLRTVESAYAMYRNAANSDLEPGLLSTPGASAHNKGMAADLVQHDAQGRLVPMGGNFDHLDMRSNHRNNQALPEDVRQNRRRREIAFQHAALSQGRLFAPLRSEFWDERFPESAADHWRVLESLCRCLERPFFSEDEHRAFASETGRQEFKKIWEDMDYARFTLHWHRLFDNAQLREALSLADDAALPPREHTVLYHGRFHPLYDRDLKASGKHLSEIIP